MFHLAQQAAQAADGGLPAELVAIAVAAFLRWAYAEFKGTRLAKALHVVVLGVDKGTSDFVASEWDGLKFKKSIQLDAEKAGVEPLLNRELKKARKKDEAK